MESRSGKSLRNPLQDFERDDLLRVLEEKLEWPMLILSFAWLVLVMIDLSVGLSPFLQKLSDLIWILFIFDFVLKFWIAPYKVPFLKANLLLIAALALPALRIFRVFRVLRYARAVRGISFAKVLTSANRGIRALGKSLGRRGFGYVLALTLLMTFLGAAGILTFEKNFGFITDYGTSVWWTAMIMTTMGSDYFPKSAEGRLLCLLLATYGFAVFGYVTATVATYFVGRDAESDEAEVAGQKSILELKQEIQDLRKEIQALLQGAQGGSAT